MMFTETCQKLICVIFHTKHPEKTIKTLYFALTLMARHMLLKSSWFKIEKRKQIEFKINRENMHEIEIII